MIYDFLYNNMSRYCGQGLANCCFYLYIYKETWLGSRGVRFALIFSSCCIFFFPALSSLLGSGHCHLLFFSFALLS